MDKKLISRITEKNLSFFILCIFATVTFMMQVANALYAKGTINNVEYTIFMFKINITIDTYNHTYSIFNYPLIPILAGVIYNSYFKIKNYRSKNTIDS